MASIGISSTNRVKHNVVRETTFGVTNTSPAFRTLRTTGSSLSADPQTTASDEIRADRQVTDLILVALQSRGDVNAEISFTEIDPDLEEALQSAWSTKPNFVNTAAGTPISALSTTAATVASGGAAFVAGMVVLFTGFANAANDGIWKPVVSSGSTTVTFAASSFTADASPQAGAAMRVVGFEGASADITATASGLGSTVLDFTTLGLVAGEWVNIGGSATGTQFATAANNGWARISAIATHALTFDILPTGWATDSGTGKTLVFWFGDVLRNGSTQYSNTIERQYQDQATPTYEYFNGMSLDKMAISLSAQKVATLVKSYVGGNASVATTRVSGATDTAANAYPVMNASANVGRLGVGGSADIGPDFITEMSLSMSNNLRQLFALGSLSAVGVGDGEMTITGTLNSYFGDILYYNSLIGNTSTSIDFRLQATSALNGTYLFDMPYVKLTSGAPTVPGKNQNVMLNLGFQALRHPTLGYEMHVNRFWYFE